MEFLQGSMIGDKKIDEVKTDVLLHLHGLILAKASSHND